MSPRRITGMRLNREIQTDQTSRREFAATLAVTAAAPAALAQQPPPAAAQTAPPARRGLPPEAMPFETIGPFVRKDAPFKAQPFPMTQVRLSAGPFKDAQEANHRMLLRMPADRLLHNFRVNAGLPSNAEPLGGWEQGPNPQGQQRGSELRGHYTGHFLSACALMFASTGDRELKAKGDYIAAELAKCQDRLSGGYLSAFPLEFFDRLNRLEQVWAPFYTLHKIMAGLLDMHVYGGNRQALEVLGKMADWVDAWTAAHSEQHMQEILNTEYGGIAETLYDLAAVTGEVRYARAADRFHKKIFLNPLGLRRDQLRGLHANTHIPQVIAAARRYEISGDARFRDAAEFFWHEVVSARTYVTGGTSNAEHWAREPRRLAAELAVSVNTQECCCAYNMLKLTRHLYAWTADPRYFDYYERCLYNHRLGTIDLETGATQYFHSLTSGAWKTFNAEYNSFWCCTGTGAEEFSKLNDSIYYHSPDGVYVNLYIASELDWPERGLRLRQDTRFPFSPSASLTVLAAKPLQMAIALRMPQWAAGARVLLNGRALEACAGPGAYLSLRRVWKQGDRVDIEFPMQLSTEALADDSGLQAVLYGPLVLAGDLGSEGLTRELIVGSMGPRIQNVPKLDIPPLPLAGQELEKRIRPADKPLEFQTVSSQRRLTLAPINSMYGKRYVVYWRVI
jgi:DUF1680 family protein